MFNWLKKKESEHAEIKDLLFGDLPYDKWPPSSSTQEQEEPWSSFVRAKKHLKTGNKTEAMQDLHQVLHQSELESRHYLQAWHFLRELGVHLTDSDQPKHVYGVVVEVSLTQGLDLLAAYADHTARYFNYSGAGVVWDGPDNSLDAAIDALLERAQLVADKIGPWENPRPGVPPKGEVRINMLTPSGIHFGQGEMNSLLNDPLGGPVLSLATALMQQLITKTESVQKK